MKQKKTLKSDKSYPDNFWPILITLLTAGAFIYWVMTSPHADATLHTYLIDHIHNILGPF
tara:strand:- start:226 stop:405 length:180 start_codon:yes stop_codon:yes gene_type:complete